MSNLPEYLTVPGAIDLHTHLREPSDINTAENYNTGTLAALHGGFVELNDMPNTQGCPTVTLERVVEKHVRAIRNGNIPIGIVGGVDPESQDTSQIEPMSPLISFWKFYMDITTGMEKKFSVQRFEPFVDEIHRVDPKKLIAVHAGEDAVPETIELIADKYQHPLHFCHMNDPNDVLEIIKAKSRNPNLQISCGVTPHHLFLSELDLTRLGTKGLMQPPLAKPFDSEQLFYQLKNGVIDIVETDHAPHTLEAKNADPDKPVYGVPNLEFSNRLLLHQVALGRLSLRRFVEVTSSGPAHILGLRVHSETKVTYNMHETRITPEDVVSKAGWTPFEGLQIAGRVVEVSIRGKSVFELNRLRQVVSQRGTEI